tara:strand:+ start:909 stop:1091 length:183 start_codon:yes stop_codon:yes gene_type:complete
MNDITDSLAAQLGELQAENKRLREAMERCALIVDRNLYRQSEKIEDVPILLRYAMKDQQQ